MIIIRKTNTTGTEKVKSAGFRWFKGGYELVQKSPLDQGEVT